MKALVATLIVCFLAIHCLAQSVNSKDFVCGDCKSLTIREISKTDEKELYCFLSGFKKCYNNVEYMEHANPILFALLQHDSKEMIDLLNKYPELNNKNIYDELEHPLVENDIKRLMFIVDRSNDASPIKQVILNALSKIKNE